MIQALARLSRAMLILSAVCGVILTVFVALSAVMRYALGQPFNFTEELVGLLFSALVFLALPYVTVHRRHICINLLTSQFPPALRRVTDLAADLLVVLFCIWFGYYAFDFTAFSRELGSRSDLAGLTLWPWMSLMVLASLLMGLGSLLLISHPAPPADPPLADGAGEEY